MLVIAFQVTYLVPRANSKFILGWHIYAHLGIKDAVKTCITFSGEITQNYLSYKTKVSYMLVWAKWLVEKHRIWWSFIIDSY